MLIRKSRNMYIDLVCSYIVEEISTDARYWHTTGLGYLMRDERQFVPCLVECWKWQKFLQAGAELGQAQVKLEVIVAVGVEDRCIYPEWGGSVAESMWWVGGCGKWN